MKKTHKTLFLFATFLSIFFPLSVSANSIFSCEAKRVSGDNQMLKPNVYENIIYPTMVISNEDDTILYVYSEHGRKWENNYKIIAMRTFGGINKIINKKNLKKLIMYNVSNKLVKKIIVGVNNRKQLNQLLKIC